MYQQKKFTLNSVLALMNKTDEQFVAEFLNGDQQALELLIEKYLKPLYNFTFQLVQDAAAAEDITQDVFLKMWKNISSYDANKKFSTWLFAIAKNTAFDWLKKKKAIAFSAFETEEGENYLENIADENILYSYELLQKIDNAKNVEELLEQLPPQLKTILLLHHKYGFSLVEIAEIMGQSSNTLKSKYRRAILELRQKFFAKNIYFKT